MDKMKLWVLVVCVVIVIAIYAAALLIKAGDHGNWDVRDE